MMSTVLPTPAPPNRPILPPARYGRQQVDDLDAGLEHLRLAARARRRPGRRGGCPSARRRRSWRRRRRAASPHTFHTWPSTCVADRHLMPWPVLRTGVPRVEAVGRLHADRPARGCRRAAGRPRPSTVDRLAVDVAPSNSRARVELGQGAARELDVDHRAGDGRRPGRP